jgi:hypothetical protein
MRDIFLSDTSVSNRIIPCSAQSDAAERVSVTNSWQKATFFATLALVTALPLFGLGFALPLLHPSGTNFPAIMAAMFPILAATGVGHVASTTFLYIDKGFWPLIRQNSARFFLWPLIAVGVFLGAYLAGPAVAVSFSLVFAAWQLHHYQRQNYGLIAFAAQDRRFGPLPVGLRRALDLSTAGGVFGLISNAGFATAYAGQHHALLIGLRVCAIGLFSASALTLGQLLISQRRLRSDRLVLAFTLLAWAFFLPVLMSHDILVAVMSFAIGHGAQYLIFLVIISRRSHYQWLGPILMVGVTFATWKIFTWLGNSAAGAAVYTGLVAGHFMIDAKVWRMRDPLQRELIRDRFSFLFE